MDPVSSLHQLSYLRGTAGEISMVCIECKIKLLQSVVRQLKKLLIGVGHVPSRGRWPSHDELMLQNFPKKSVYICFYFLDFLKASFQKLVWVGPRAKVAPVLGRRGTSSPPSVPAPSNTPAQDGFGPQDRLVLPWVPGNGLDDLLRSLAVLHFYDSILE